MRHFLKIPFSYLISFLFGLLFFANVEAAFAETHWQGLVLGEITFSAPADWNITHQTPNEIRLESRDSKTRLLVFWWTPDEPLLGYDDIVSHEKRTVSGNGAVRRQIKWNSLQPELMEVLAHLGLHFRRHSCGEASGEF